MELHLRKARALEQKIQNHLDTTRINTTSVVRVQGTLEEAIKGLDEARELALKEFPVRGELLKLRFRIRREIEKKNESTGINELINAVVLNEALVKDIQTNPVSARAEGVHFEDHFNHQVAQFKAPVDQYSRTKSLSYGSQIFTKADVDAVAAQLRTLSKEKESLQDKIGEKNIVGKVTLTEDEVKLLESVGLV
jgi:hypothetical protein